MTPKINKKLSDNQIDLLQHLDKFGPHNRDEICEVLFGKNINNLNDKEVWSLLCVIGDSVQDRIVQFNPHTNKYSISQYAQMNFKMLWA